MLKQIEGQTVDYEITIRGVVQKDGRILPVVDFRKSTEAIGNMADVFMGIAALMLSMVVWVNKSEGGSLEACAYSCIRTLSNDLDLLLRDSSFEERPLEDLS